jgi:hypothetical protein
MEEYLPRDFTLPKQTLELLTSYKSSSSSPFLECTIGEDGTEYDVGRGEDNDKDDDEDDEEYETKFDDVVGDGLRTEPFFAVRFGKSVCINKLFLDLIGFFVAFWK